MALLLGMAMPSVGEPLEQEKRAEYDVKAAFMLSVVKFVTWPKGTFTSAKPRLVVGVLGPDPFGKYLTRYRGKSVRLAGTKVVIEVVAFDDPAKVTGCHVLFVSKKLGGDSAAILARCPSSGVLTVSDRADFALRGGMIRLFKRSRRVRFDLNRAAIKKGALAVPARLLRMANRIIEDGK